MNQGLEISSSTRLESALADNGGGPNSSIPTSPNHEKELLFYSGFNTTNTSVKSNKNIKMIASFPPHLPTWRELNGKF
jgi:hypothetical protein